MGRGSSKAGSRSSSAGGYAPSVGASAGGGQFYGSRVNPQQITAGSADALKSILQDKGYRIAGGGPYRSNTSSDMLMDIVGNDRVFTGTYNRYSDGGVELIDLKPKVKSVSAKQTDAFLRGKRERRS